MTEELKPCPFCGAPSKYEDGGFNAVRVACSDYDNCVSKMRVHKGVKEHRSLLAAHWNTRAAPQPALSRTAGELANKLINRKILPIGSWEDDVPSTTETFFRQEIQSALTAEYERGKADGIKSAYDDDALTISHMLGFEEGKKVGLAQGKAVPEGFVFVPKEPTNKKEGV